MTCYYTKPLRGSIACLYWFFCLLLLSVFVCIPASASGKSWKPHLAFLQAPQSLSVSYSSFILSAKGCTGYLFCCATEATTPFMAEATSLLLLDSSKKSLSDPLDAGSSENSKGGQGTPPNALAVESSEADSLSNKEQLSEKKTALVTEEKLPQSDTGGRQGTSSSAKTVRLFGYVEFRGPLKNIPKWQRVLGAELPALTFEGYQTKNMPPAVAERWNKLAGSLKDAPLKEKIQKVNIFFNQWQYKTDMTVWGVEDYWATPKEFIRKSGDCEDYAITKYFALRSLGVPINQMRILAVRERIRGIGHAVLVVFMDDSAYILDNMTNLVLPHTRLTNYEPKFSVNEEYRWAYVKPIAKTK